MIIFPAELVAQQRFPKRSLSGGGAEEGGSALSCDCEPVSSSTTSSRVSKIFTAIIAIVNTKLGVICNGIVFLSATSANLNEMA